MSKSIESMTRDVETSIYAILARLKAEPKRSDEWSHIRRALHDAEREANKVFHFCLSVED